MLATKIDRQRETSRNRRLTFRNWRRKWYVLPKRRAVSVLNGVTTQKALHFIVTAVITWTRNSNGNSNGISTHMYRKSPGKSAAKSAFVYYGSVSKHRKACSILRQSLIIGDGIARSNCFLRQPTAGIWGITASRRPLLPETNKTFNGKGQSCKQFPCFYTGPFSAECAMEWADSANRDKGCRVCIG
jgi:hypothetical protein